MKDFGFSDKILPKLDLQVINPLFDLLKLRNKILIKKMIYIRNKDDKYL